MLNISEVKCSELTEVQKETSLLYIDSEGYINAIMYDRKIVGYINYSIDISEKALDIDTIELLETEKNKGYGRKTIEFLFKNHPGINKIKGISHPNAVGFWSKLGSYFYETCETCDYTSCVYNENFNASLDKDYISEDYCDDYSECHFSLPKF